MTEVLSELVLALSLQETEKQSAGTMAEKLLQFFSVIPWPISGSGAKFATMSNAEEKGCFRLSSSSILKIQKGNITGWFVDGSSDAIVNPANEQMLASGGADAAIHSAAGPEVQTACYNFSQVRPAVRCPTGEARITPYCIFNSFYV